jgi:hypothetical protein
VARWMCCCGYMTRVDVAASSQKEAAVLDLAAVGFAPILRSSLLLNNPISNLFLRQLQGPKPSTGRVRSNGTTMAMRHVRGLVTSLRGRVLARRIHQVTTTSHSAFAAQRLSSQSRSINADKFGTSMHIRKIRWGMSRKQPHISARTLSVRYNCKSRSGCLATIAAEFIADDREVFDGDVGPLWVACGCRDKVGLLLALSPEMARQRPVKNESSGLGMSVGSIPTGLEDKLRCNMHHGSNMVDSCGFRSRLVGHRDFAEAAENHEYPD